MDRSAIRQRIKKLRDDGIHWNEWNKETYNILGIKPLSEKHKRSFPNPFPVALVSLFSVENIGIRYLYAFLREAGYDVDLIFLKEYATNNFEMPSDAELELLFERFRQRGYQLIGLGARSGYIKFCVELTERIHQKLDVPVVWGGTVGTVTPELCIQGGADYAVQHEGEAATAGLIRCLATGKDPRELPNLWWGDENGEPIGNEPDSLIPTLDALPIQDLEDENKCFIEFGKLTEGDPWRNLVKYETLTARGCPYKCTFCINSQLVKLEKGLGKLVRGASVEKVMRELEYAMAKLPHMKSIFFADEVFGTGMAWMRDFAREYPQRVALPFEVAIDPRALNEEKVRLLVEAGMAELNVGIQAGSERIRTELFDRPVSDQTLLEVARWMKANKVFTRYDIIADNPWETAEDKRRTLDILLQLPRPFILNIYSMNWFPKTVLTEKALEEGIIDENQVAGQSEKSLTQFTVSFDYPRTKEDMFWNALYSMTSKPFIPKSLIQVLARMAILKRYPRPLVMFARMSSLVRVFCAGLLLLWQGRIGLDTARRFSKSLGSINR